MTETVNTSPDAQTAVADEAATVSQDARAQQAAAERVARESDIETAETKEKSRSLKSGLSSLFGAATGLGSYFLLHNMPAHGKIGKGPDCVVDHGSYIYIPANATAAHLQQVAQLAQSKGWTHIAVHKENGRGLHEKFSGGLQQVAPNLGVCTDHRAAGSVYSNRRHAILHHYERKAMQRAMSEMREAPAPLEAQPQPQPA